MEEKQKFWLGFLRLGALVVIATGLLPSLAIFEASQEPWRFFFDVLTWPIDQNPLSFSDSERQLSAVLGGVLCGWGWILYRLATPDLFNPMIRKFMVQSVWIWFILDSVGSILAGLSLNALSNVSFLLILLVPLNALKKVS
jgi:hypothetical protein